VAPDSERGTAPRGRAALPPVLALVAALSVAAFCAGSAAARETSFPRVQELALLLAPHTARSAPTANSRLVQVVGARRPITEGRTALPVIGEATGADGSDWLHVRLPGRPNGRTGWIAKHATASAVTHWRLVVDRAARRVTAYRDGRVQRSFAAVVGKPSTPTPRGEYFVEEAVELPAGDVGAPYALALSARSTVYQEFAGGPGQIALHGVKNVGGVLGTAVTHGCVRLADDAMLWLVTRMGSGVPVTIRR
jgi:lipoprotein-anchoring transpeptidase ErfK/SrfK